MRYQLELGDATAFLALADELDFTGHEHAEFLQACALEVRDNPNQIIQLTAAAMFLDVLEKTCGSYQEKAKEQG